MEVIFFFTHLWWKPVELLQKRYHMLKQIHLFKNCCLHAHWADLRELLAVTEILHPFYIIAERCNNVNLSNYTRAINAALSLSVTHCEVKDTQRIDIAFHLKSYVYSLN